MFPGQRKEEVGASQGVGGEEGYDEDPCQEGHEDSSGEEIRREEEENIATSALYRKHQELLHNRGEENSGCRKTDAGDEETLQYGKPDVSNSVKTTFEPVVRGVKSVREAIRKHEALMKKCEFGNGRCMTHYVKLERDVRKKKYSVVNSNGNIDWKYRDVTCLVCPSQRVRDSMNVGDDELPRAVGNKKLKVTD